MTADELSLWIVSLIPAGCPVPVDGFVLGPCTASAAMHETLRRRPAGWCGQIELLPAEVSELHSL